MSYFTTAADYVASFFGPTWESLASLPDWDKFLYLCKYTDKQFLEDLCEFTLLTSNLKDPSHSCVGKTPVNECPKNTRWYVRHDEDKHTIVCGFCRNNLYLEHDKDMFKELGITLYEQQECASYHDNCFVRLLMFKDILIKTQKYVTSDKDNASVKLDQCREEYQELRGKTDESADTIKVMIDLLQ